MCIFLVNKNYFYRIPLSLMRCFVQPLEIWKQKYVTSVTSKNRPYNV